MEVAGLLSLPPETVQHLSKFLLLEDVLSCTRTCRYLRNVFNNNSVWKRFLSERTGFIPGLESHEQQVQPTTLQLLNTPTTLCDDWLRALNQYRLTRNWRSGHFLKDTATLNTASFLNVWLDRNIHYNKQLPIYKGKYVFLPRREGVIEVWDVKKYPVLQRELNVQIKVGYYNTFYIFSEMLVVVRDVEVDVYKIAIAEKIPLIYSFLMFEDNYIWYPSASYRQTLTYSQYVDKRSKLRVKSNWNPFVTDRYLLLIQYGEGNGIFHIWDIYNASKVGSFISSMELHDPTGNYLSPSNLCVFSFSKNNLILRQTMISLSTSFVHTYLFSFSMETKKFSESVLNHKGYHVFPYGTHMVTIRFMLCNNFKVFTTVCYVYDIRSLKQVNTRSFPEAKFINRSLEIVKGRFVLQNELGFLIIDAISLDIVERVLCEGVRSIPYQFNLFGSLILVIENINNRNLLELWDVEANKKILTTLNIESSPYFRLFTDNLCTKLVYLSEGNVDIFNFW